MRVFALSTVLLFFSAACFYAAGVRKVDDSIVDEHALHFTNGTWGFCVNGQAFQQDAVTTFNGYQYATYYDADQHLCVARRELGDRRRSNGAWQVIRFSDYLFKGNDTHNVAVIGICPRDGTIHLSWDHHGHPLHYRVSQKGVASHPEKVQWTTNDFGPITNELERGKKLTRVTYPRFVRTPQGGYRIGGSGDGEKCLADYDGKSGTWTDLGACFGSKGNYQGQLTRNPYLNGYSYDSRGRLHVTWCWRETGDPSTNHDLDYAWSKDNGHTWFNNDGHRFGARGKELVTIESPGVQAVEIGMNRGLMNSVTQAVDSRNQLHVVTSHLPDEKPGSKVWEEIRQQTVYFHYWRDGKGEWHRNQMNFIGSRPQLWFDTADNAYIVFVGDRFNPSPNLSIAKATRAKNWQDWTVVYTEAGPFSGQPQVDRYAKENTLSVYIQNEPGNVDRSSSALRVITFAPAK